MEYEGRGEIVNYFASVLCKYGNKEWEEKNVATTWKFFRYTIGERTDRRFNERHSWLGRYNGSQTGGTSTILPGVMERREKKKRKKNSPGIMEM